ncbi:MAG TPA: protein YgfX [Oleiagrimonas sp.]|nr:protein YgfX [Oleiagrimonas sp.]HET8553718.1 protein YgfX [Rhodanobacteraceae bacterium]
MPSAPTITFEVRPSRLLAATVTIMALLACAAVACSRLPWTFDLALCALIVLYAWHSLRRLKRQPLTMLGWHADDTWTLHLTGNRQVQGRLCSGRVLGPLIMLRLIWPQGGETALALLPDSVDADTRRRLRMRLSAMSDNA